MNTIWPLAVRFIRNEGNGNMSLENEKSQAKYYQWKKSTGFNGDLLGWNSTYNQIILICIKEQRKEEKKLSETVKNTVRIKLSTIQWTLLAQCHGNNHNNQDSTFINTLIRKDFYIYFLKLLYSKIND